MLLRHTLLPHTATSHLELTILSSFRVYRSYQPRRRRRNRPRPRLPSPPPQLQLRLLPLLLQRHLHWSSFPGSAIFPTVKPFPGALTKVRRKDWVSCPFSRASTSSSQEPRASWPKVRSCKHQAYDCLVFPLPFFLAARNPVKTLSALCDSMRS